MSELARDASIRLPRGADCVRPVRPERRRRRLRARRQVRRDSDSRSTALITRRSINVDPERMAFPPVLPQAAARADRVSLVVPAPRGDDLLVRRRRDEAVELERRAAEARGLERFQSQTRSCWCPAACYPVVPRSRRARPAAGRGRHRRSGRLATCFGTSRPRTRRGCRCSTSARWFASASPTWCSSGVTVVERALEILARLGLDAQADLASDPFFGRSGRMLARSQRSQALKFEVGVPIGGEEPTAVASFNATASTSRRSTASGSRTASRPTRRASASASSASRSRCCSAGTASTGDRGRGD